MPEPMIPPITIIVASNNPSRRARLGAASDVGFSLSPFVGLRQISNQLRFACGLQSFPHTHLPFRARRIFLFKLAERLAKRFPADLPGL